MEDLKSLVITQLEDEGTLNNMRAQLRSQVFKAIEKYADKPTKQQAGFQWQNPIAHKIAENEDAKLMAQMIREFLEFYRMDYTLSVYLPEVAMSNDAVQRDDLAKQGGVS